jgi:hypothetical protein
MPLTVWSARFASALTHFRRRACERIRRRSAGHPVTYVLCRSVDCPASPSQSKPVHGDTSQCRTHRMLCVTPMSLSIHSPARRDLMK